MKVKDLIEILQEIDPEEEVLYEDGTFGGVIFHVLGCPPMEK